MSRSTTKPARNPKPPKNPYKKFLDQYYATLKGFQHQYALHEGAVSTAFQSLLSDAARSRHWTLIPQLGDKSGEKSIRPGDTLKDQMYLVRGHWKLVT